jgi:hypothetical protein
MMVIAWIGLTRRGHQLAKPIASRRLDELDKV